MIYFIWGYSLTVALLWGWLIAKQRSGFYSLSEFWLAIPAFVIWPVFALLLYKDIWRAMQSGWQAGKLDSK